MLRKHIEIDAVRGARLRKVGNVGAGQKAVSGLRPVCHIETSADERLLIGNLKRDLPNINTLHRRFVLLVGFNGTHATEPTFRRKIIDRVPYYDDENAHRYFCTRSDKQDGRHYGE